MNFDEAVKFAIAAFEEAHATLPIPHWLMKGITPCGKKDKAGNWDIDLIIHKTVELDENEFWEMRPDGPVLIEIDPVTKERFVVISKNADSLVVFKIAIFEKSKSYEIKESVNLANLNQFDFQPWGGLPNSKRDKNST